MTGLFAGIVRRLLWLAVVLLILLALYVSLGRQLVPLVAEYRPDIELRLARALGQSVSLGRVEGRWRGLSPQLLLHDVRIGGASGAVRVDRLVAIPDVFGSLWQRAPQLSAVWLDGLSLGLEQQVDGRWALEGADAAPSGPAPDPQRVLEALARIRRLVVLDSQLIVEPHGAQPFAFNYVNLELSSSDGRLRLDGRGLLPDGQPLALHAQGAIDPAHWQQGQVEAYVSLPQSRWSDWLPSGWGTPWRIDALQAGGEAWLAWRDGAVQRASARLNGATLTLAHGQRAPATVEDFALSLHAQRTPDGLRALVDDLAFNTAGQRVDEMRASIERMDETGALEARWTVSVDRLAIGPLASLVAGLAPLPEAGAEALRVMAPTGLVRNLRLDYLPEATGPTRLRYAMNLEDAGFGAWHGVPAVSRVDGSVVGDLARGEARLSADDFSFHLAQLFPEPWVYRQARGRLTWSIDDDGLSLAVPYARFEGEEGRLAADLSLRLFKDPAVEDYMDLRVGLSDGDARFVDRYLPTRSPALSPALADWLGTAIQAGTIEQGYFQYQGALVGAAAHSRTLSLFFRVRDAELAFQPGWPALRQGRGEVFIDDQGARVALAEGRLLDSRIHDAIARIPRAEPGQAPRLALHGSIDGQVADALSILQTAPIGTASVFAGWTGSGAVTAELQLDLPLNGETAPHVVVDFAPQQAQLSMATPDLQLEQLSGRLRYDTAAGLSADQVRAVAFGEPVQVTAKATGAPGQPETRLEARGSIAVSRLSEWLGFTGPLPISGRLPYLLQLSLAGRDSEVVVHSSLLGATIDLPEPFTKPPDERRDTSWRMTLDGPERLYWLRHEDLASLAYAAPANDWRRGRGELRLGGAAARLPATDGLRVEGRLAQLDWAAWKDAFARYVPADEGISGSGGQPAGESSWLRSAALQIGRFDGFGTTVEDLRLGVKRTPDRWQLDLDSHRIAGTVAVPVDESPMQIALRHLRFPAAEPAQGERTADPLADIDPRQLPAADVTIEALYLGDARLGRWTGNLRPIAGGAALTDLSLELKGLTLTGALDWMPADSRFRGRVAGDNLADVLQAWGYEPSLTSERFRMDVDGHWPGSPAWVSLERFSGSLEPRLRNGTVAQMDGGAQALRVFGLLNFESIGRRLRLDFSDLFGRGLSYDRLKGRLVATDGVYVTREPITLDGPSSNLELSGTLDLVSDRIDAKLLVTLPVSNNLPLAAIIAGAPAVGGALFLVDKLLGDRVARFASVQYDVEGPWQDPKITFDKPFEKPEG
ncbi:TIGR02099 family protein [Stutzerimonas urumqiensis]|uniref:YhdP family protein n=1 Tax=Stutzerimonas urumqiensis TaxID=638269 RepID=UPI003DA40DE8